MIVKQVGAKKGTGSFKGLAYYQLDTINQGKKVQGLPEFANCPFSTVYENLQYIEDTAMLNQNASSDKTLHLVISFQEDEEPPKKVLQDIELELIKSIGMQDHQRMSVAHNNTNNFHFHMAINKIHPESHKLIDPYQSKNKLLTKAKELEEKHHLKSDQHLKREKLIEKYKEIKFKIGMENGRRNYTDQQRRVARVYKSFNLKTGEGKQTKSLYDLRKLPHCDVVRGLSGTKMLLQINDAIELGRSGGRIGNTVRWSRTSDIRDYGEERGGENEVEELQQEDQSFGMSDDDIYDELIGGDKTPAEMTEEDMYNAMMAEMANDQPPHEMSDDDIYDELMLQQEDQSFGMSDDDIYDELIGGDGVDKTLSQNKDIEIHSGMDNLSTWIKEQVLEDLLKVLKDESKTFDDFQETLAKANLEIKPRANGITIAHKTRKLFVKPSAIHRDLSKGKLEKRFSELEFKSFDIKFEKEFGISKNSLWDNYQAESQEKRETKKELFSQAKENNLQKKIRIKEKFEKLIADTKKDFFITKKAKRNIYMNLFERRKEESKKLSASYKKERDKIFKQTNQISYKEYLIGRALEGDKTALKLLRKTKPPLIKDENAILGKKDDGVFITREPMVTKQGLVIYKIDGGKIIDKGDRLKITIDSNEVAIKEMLDMAVAKYGKELDISGDIEFKQKVLTVTEKYDLDINFKDKTMQEIKNAQKLEKEKRKTKETKQDDKKAKKGI